MDHILPQKYDEKLDEWSYIKEDREKIIPYLNKIGNMALLLGKKNEEALNFGFAKKIDIYLGEDNKNTGRTAFDTTNWIINDYDSNDEYKSKWDIDHIEARQLKLISEIEELLGISRDDILEEEKYIPDVSSPKGGYYKWKYKDEYCTNASLVRKIISDYINKHNYKSLSELDDEIRNYHIIPILPLLAEDNVENGYTYVKIKDIDFNLYSPSQFNEERLNVFFQTIKKYYDYESYLSNIED